MALRLGGLADLVLGGDPALLADARAVVRPALSRRVARHYGGFATSQLRAFDDKPTAKRALYVLRTAATGRNLLAHGEIVTDVAKLTAFVPGEIGELIEIKRKAERQQLAPDQVAAWRARLTAAIDAVDAAWPTSILPPDPTPEAIAAIDDWLRGIRRQFWWRRAHDLGMVSSSRWSTSGASVPAMPSTSRSRTTAR
ncbi:MAG TPA: nucleotidyltransferase domain-containing protein [Kofleriaceae bacterium]